MSSRILIGQRISLGITERRGEKMPSGDVQLADFVDEYNDYKRGKIEKLRFSQGRDLAYGRFFFEEVCCAREMKTLLCHLQVDVLYQKRMLL